MVTSCKCHRSSSRLCLCNHLDWDGGRFVPGLHHVRCVCGHRLLPQPVHRDKKRDHIVPEGGHRLEHCVPLWHAPTQPYKLDLANGIPLFSDFEGTYIRKHRMNRTQSLVFTIWGPLTPLAISCGLLLDVACVCQRELAHDKPFRVIKVDALMLMLFFTFYVTFFEGNKQGEKL